MKDACFTLVQKEVFKCVSFPSEHRNWSFWLLSIDSSLEGKRYSACGDAAADCAAENLIISRNGKDASAKMQQTA